MKKWVNDAIGILNKIKTDDHEEEKAVRLMLRVFTDGKGYLTDHQPIKIFFFDELA